MSGFANLPGSVSGFLGVKSTRLQPTIEPASPKEGELYYNNADNAAYIYSGTVWVKITNNFSAEGGDSTALYGAFKIHIFTSSGNLVVDASGSIDLLMVAGGGGAGSNGGGGGAGGFKYHPAMDVISGTYVVTIGPGGAGSSTNTAQGTNGTNTTFVNSGASVSITANGGGGGGSQNTGQQVGEDGGSGGGGGQRDDASANGGSGVANQGNDGGSGHQTGGMTGGGGGGASAAGEDGDDSGNAGDGGAGYTEGATVYNWTAASGTTTFPATFKVGSGSNLAYAGGGGGKADTSQGAAGVGGGGTATADGAANTGGGGGANGGAGGSGILIVRYNV